MGSRIRWKRHRRLSPSFGGHDGRRQQRNDEGMKRSDSVHGDNDTLPSSNIYVIFVIHYHHLKFVFLFGYRGSCEVCYLDWSKLFPVCAMMRLPPGLVWLIRIS